MIVPVLILTAVAYSVANSLINPILVEVAQTFRVPVGVAGQARTILSAAGAIAALGATFLADRCRGGGSCCSAWWRSGSDTPASRFRARSRCG